MPDRRMDWGLIVLAVAVRAAAVLVLQSHKVPHSTYEHGEIAANLLAGRGFSVRFLGADGPTRSRRRSIPFLVAGAYALGGVGTPRALLILELGQAALGGLLVAGVLMLAREVAPGRRRVALVAGAIAAVHPTLVYAATHVQVALLAATLLTVDPRLGLPDGPHGARPRCGRARACCWRCSCSPTRSSASPARASPGRSRSGRGSARPGPPAGRDRCSRPALGVAPWIVRNARVHGEFVFIKSTFGYAFWQGNCALSEGTDKVVRASVDRAWNAEAASGLRGLTTRSGTPGTRRAISTTSP